MVDVDLCYTPATELVGLIQRRELSPVELVENSLARIDQVAEALNCFCFVYPEEALEAARRAERDVGADHATGRLQGIPVAIKDLTPTAGKRTTLGSKAFEHWVPATSAVVVERLLGDGAIMVGKTTTPELAWTGVTESPLWGVTRNPWDTSRYPGGSSGGAAAAVASGCVPLAEGSDMGGSIRIPAASCGIVGLKPSHGRIPLEFMPTQVDPIHHVGPLTRTVADARLFLAATQGPDDRDLMSLGNVLDLDGPAETSAVGLRLALDVDLGFYDVAPDVEREVRAAADALRRAGAVVEEVDLGWARELPDAWLDNWAAYLGASFTEAFARHGDEMDPDLVALVGHAATLSALDLKRTELVRTRAWRALRAVLVRYDALLCPTMSRTACPVGDAARFAVSDDAGRYVARDMTSEFNCFSPCPVLSVPAGWADDGLPVGLQVVAGRYRDDVALRVGSAVEQVRPWADRRPPV